jgi:hypothetical protein
MTEINHFEIESKVAKQEAESAKENAEADKKAIKEEADRRCNKVDREIKDKQNHAKNLEESLSERKKTAEKKILEIDTALKRIEEISKTAPQ